MGVQCECTLVTEKRFVRPVELVQDRAAVVERGGVVRIESEGAVITRKSFFEPVQRAQDIAVIVVDEGIVGSDKNRAAYQVRRINGTVIA